MFHPLLMLSPFLLFAGWYVGYRTPIGNPTHTARLPRDYILGLNYLINEQPDKAVDLFIKLLEVNEETIETHLVLGNLFRRRGEVDRAIRVHQNIINRPRLAAAHRMDALLELGQDYLKAGVLDRAEQLFLELVEFRQHLSESLRMLLHIYQQEKDWDQAVEVAKRLQKETGESMSPIISQYYCELAERYCQQGDLEGAHQFLKRAHGMDHQNVRVYMVKAQLLMKAQDYAEAIRNFKRVIEKNVHYIVEIIDALNYCYRAIGDDSGFLNYLEGCLLSRPGIAVMLTYADYLQKSQDSQAAMEFMSRQIQLEPSLHGMSHLLDLYLKNKRPLEVEQLKALQEMVHQLLVDVPTYRCTQCGFSGKMLYWLCPSCHRWNSVQPIFGTDRK